MAEKALPQQFRIQKRIFWLVFWCCILALLIMPCVVQFGQDASWRQIWEEFAGTEAKWWLLYAFAVFCFSMPFWMFYWFMRTAQTECMGRYRKLSKKEQQEVSRVYGKEIYFGKISMLEDCFLFVDTRRLLMRSIISYDEVIWAYISRLNYQYQNMERMVIFPTMQYFSLVLMTKDGKKHSVFLGGTLYIEQWEALQKRLPSEVIYGYGKLQRRQAKDRCRWYAAQEPSIAEQRRAARKRNIFTVLAILLACIVWVGAYVNCSNNIFSWRLPEHENSRNEEDSEYPETAQLYFEAADAALTSNEPLTAVSFLDKGAAACTEMQEVFRERKDYILAHLRIETCIEYRNGKKIRVMSYNDAGDIVRVVYHNGEVYEYTYDKNGNSAGQYHYNDAGELKEQTESVYDDEGRLLEVTEYDAYGVHHQLRKYDDNGRQIGFLKYQNDELFEWFEYEYDDAGNLVRTVANTDGSSSLILEAEYDAGGNRTERRCYDEQGLFWYETSTYFQEDSGEKVQETVYFERQENLQHEMLYWCQISSDASGNQTKYVRRNANGTTQEDDTEYDVSGNKIRFVRKRNGEVAFLDEYTYDTAGRMLTKSSYSSNQDVELLPVAEVSYVYDAAGNRISIEETRYSKGEETGRMSVKREYCYVYEG